MKRLEKANKTLLISKEQNLFFLHLKTEKLQLNGKIYSSLYRILSTVRVHSVSAYRLTHLILVKNEKVDKKWHSDILKYLLYVKKR